MRSYNYYHRLFFTFFSFVFFGIGGVIIGVLIYPVFWITIWNKEKRNRAGQYFIHLMFKLFVGFMKLGGIFSLTIINKEQLREPGQFFIATHPTLIDVVIMISLLENVDCVVKAKLMNNPFTSGPLKAAGYIVNSAPQQLLDSCAQTLNHGHSLLVFPEGTRTKKLDKLYFQRGAAKIAINAKHDLSPIVIKCQPRMLAKNVKWYKIPATKPEFTITIGERIKVEPFLGKNKSVNIQSRNLTNYLVNYFKEELKIV